MWFVPSRNRPDAMREFVAAVKASGDSPDVAVMLDCDPEQYKGIDWPEHWHIHHSTEHLEFQRAFNELLRLHPGEKTYGLLTDHARPITSGWSQTMEREAGDWNLVLCADGKDRINPRTNYRRLTAAVCFGGDLIREVGCFWPDFCVHLYGDDAWEEIGHELGIVKHLPDVMVQDLHFTHGEIKVDDNHKRMYRGVPYAKADFDAYIQWKAHGKQPLLARLRDVIPNRGKPSRVVNVVCVQTNNYCGMGADYVTRLYDMVMRNVPQGYPVRFVCFTDDISNLPAEIETHGLPMGQSGWWNKLALFQPGTFQPGDRVVYFDLDTLVINRLDDLFSYEGEFACLRDFYRPDGLGSGVMLWTETERTRRIWECWLDEAKPRIEGGDQAWIESVFPDADRLQDLFPGSIVSYKADCNPYPPRGTSVVCFHGYPRPHESTQKWVQDVWAVGGSSLFNITVVPNTNDSKTLDNVKANRDAAPWLVKSESHKEVALLCGSGPSLIETIPAIKASGGIVFALNNAAKILHENGVRVDYQIVLDARPENVEFVKEQYADSYLIASQAHPDVFKALTGRNVVLWHPAIPGIDELFPDRNLTLVGGGITVGLSSMSLVYAMGFRTMFLFGYDSSYREEKSHAAPQSRTNAENWTFDVTVGERTFKSNAAMAKQAEQFPILAAALVNDCDCEIAVFGDGLLPHIARNLTT